jgi:hypothetical protein
VDHISNVLEQPRAAKWFKEWWTEWWTGARGPSCMPVMLGAITIWESRSTGETPELSKKTNHLRGTAGQRRATLIASITKDKEKSGLNYLLHPATPRGGDQAVLPTPQGRRLPPSHQGAGGQIYGIRWCWWIPRSSRAWSPLLKGPGGRECVRIGGGSPRGGQGVGWKDG